MAGAWAPSIPGFDPKLEAARPYDVNKAKADGVEAPKEQDLLRDLIDQQLLLQKGTELGVTADTDVVKRLDQIRSGFFDRRALARDIEFRTKRHKSILFAFDDRRETQWLRHDPSLQHIR